MVSQYRFGVALLIALACGALSVATVRAGISGSNVTVQVLQVNNDSTWNLQWTADVTVTNPHQHVCISLNNGPRTLCSGSGPYTCTVNNVPNNTTVNWQIWGYPSAQCQGNEAAGPTGVISPLAVTLADMSAYQAGDHIIVTWETVTEIGNRGFHLWRGTTGDGPERRLNHALIPSQSPGGPAGHLYTWLDGEALSTGATYNYWLEDVDVHGVVTRHRPVSVSYLMPTAVAQQVAAHATAERLPIAPIGLLAAALIGLSVWAKRGMVWPH